MKRWLLAGALIVSTITTAVAQEQTAGAPQEKPAPAPSQTSGARQVPLKIQFVVSRYQGDKRISSLPYTLGVLAGGRQTSMRMGVQVPVVTTVFSSGSKNDTTALIPQSSYTYKDVGTNIDCSATDTGGGQYMLTVTLEDSSIQADSGDRGAKIARDVPSFRSFRASFSMLLRDGQTMQYASVTDPLSGEVMRIDVTLTLAK
jgi:hypothetical protein